MVASKKNFKKFQGAVKKFSVSKLQSRWKLPSHQKGSGTFSVEAVFQTAVPKNGKVLIMANGAYGSRMKKICETVGIECDFNLSSEAAPVPLETFEKFLKKKKWV